MQQKWSTAQFSEKLAAIWNALVAADARNARFAALAPAKDHGPALLARRSLPALSSPSRAKVAPGSSRHWRTSANGSAELAVRRRARRRKDWLGATGRGACYMPARGELWHEAYVSASTLAALPDRPWRRERHWSQNRACGAKLVGPYRPCPSRRALRALISLH